MSIIQGNTKVSAGGYAIDQSILFPSPTTGYLNRTPSSASNRKTWTWSGWIKRSKLATLAGSADAVIFGADASSSNFLHLRIDGASTNADQLYLVASSSTMAIRYAPLLRDVSAWYHIVIRMDTTDATAADRAKVYLNGDQITDIVSSTYPSLNREFAVNNTVEHDLGRLSYAGSETFEGYMAEINFVDGTALDATSFGEYNDDGVWVPKAYAGSYGTNGWYITGATAADLGEDFSGNGNDWTSTGLTASDQVPDSPTDSYCVLNPLTGVNSGSSVVTQANGNLEATMTANYVGTFGTLAANSGKYYFEYSYAADANYADGRLFGGVVCVETADHSYFRIDGGSFYLPDKVTEGNYMIKHLSGSGEQSNTGTSTSAYNTNLSSSSATGGPESGPDIYMVAMDLDNDNLYWGKNGTWYGASSTSGSDYTDATPIAILAAHQGKYFAPAFGFYGATSGTTGVLNCGQDATFGGRYSSPAGDFYYTPPTGFSKLSTANLPTPAIADGSAYFQTTTYTGAGYPTEVNQSGNSTFQPDFVWIKRRNAATTHDLFDAVRGVSSQLYSNLTSAEGTVSNAISFDADGFTAAADPITGDTGSSGNTFVGWQWLAANGTASNTDGTITSTVSANTTAGFSIVEFTGTGANATVGHGLNQAPDFILGKNQIDATNWKGFHVALGGTKNIILDSTGAASTSSANWNDTDPTATVVSVGTSNGVNGLGDDIILYCWHSVPGYSKFGSYTGNGSTDGPFIFTGFRPAFVMFKKTSGTDSWEILDNTRPGYNVTGLGLLPNTTASEATGRNIDILSNGIKQRNANGTTNEGGNTYIYMAFAENPFGGAGVAPVPAR